MSRTHLIPIALFLLLTGCGTGTEQPAAPENPAAEAGETPETPVTQAPVQDVAPPPVEETAEQVQARLAAQMGSEFARLGLCIDPRPEACTQNYAPVCGVHADGSRKTYSNGCGACSNPDVVGALPEPCPE